jgi:hypothetical protein
MAEATHTAEMMFGLRQPTGRGGGRLLAGLFQIDDTETIDTGMSFVHALVTCPVEDRAADTPFSCPTSAATTGVVTMSVGAWDDAAADSGSNHYVIAVGVD